MKKNLLFLPVVLFVFTAVAFPQDQGMTGETHKKNVGKILLAKERIKKDMQDQMTSETASCQINLNLAAGDNVDDTNGGVPEKWAELVKALPDGAHACKFEIYGATTRVQFFLVTFV